MLCSLRRDHVYHYIPILNYLLMHFIIIIYGFTHSLTRLTGNHTNASANTTEVLFDYWVPAPVCVNWFERWRLALESFKIKCTNGLAHHQFRTSNNQFIRHLNGKSIFLRRLTLTWLLDGPWTWTPCRLKVIFQFIDLLIVRVNEIAARLPMVRWLANARHFIFITFGKGEKCHSTVESRFRCFTQQKQKCQSWALLVIDKQRTILLTWDTFAYMCDSNFASAQ